MTGNRFCALALGVALAAAATPAFATKLIDLTAKPTPALAQAPPIAPPAQAALKAFPPPRNSGENSMPAAAQAGYAAAMNSPIVTAVLKDPTGFMIGLRVAVILAMVMRLLRFVGVGGAKVLALAAMAGCAYLGVAMGAFAPWLG